jgi:hypothetical protein
MAFMWARGSIIEKVGLAYRTVAPGANTALNAESKTSSEPAPVVTQSGSTSNRTDTASRRTSAYNSG